MGKTKAVLRASLLAIALIPAFATAEDANRGAEELAAEYALQLQVDQLALDLEMAPIKSASDVASYRQSVRGKWSPLNSIAPRDRADFIKSLTFNEKGVTGFDYRYLTSLTAREIYQVLSLFGMQSGAHKIPSRDGSTIKPLGDAEPPLGVEGFLEDYRCESPGTCTAANFKACTSNC